MCSAALIACVAQTAASVGAQSVVIAVVNGAPLERWEAERELAQLVSAGSYHSNISPERRAELEQEALDRLILKELERQWLRGRKIPVDPVAVEQAWSEVRKRFESEEAYQSALRMKGIDHTAFRRSFDRDAAAAAAESLVVDGVPEPTDLEVEVFFMLHRDEYRRPEARHAVHALVFVPPTASREQWHRAEQRALDLVSEVRDRGMSLEEAARPLRSGVPPQHRDEIGDLGYVHRGSLQPVLDAAVFEARPGSVTDPIKSIYGFHVIEVIDVRPPQDMELDEVRASVVARIVREQRERELAEHEDRLRAGAKIEVIGWQGTS